MVFLQSKQEKTTTIRFSISLSTSSSFAISVRTAALPHIFTRAVIADLLIAYGRKHSKFQTILSPSNLVNAK